MHNPQNRTNVLFLLFLIGLVAFPFLLPKQNVVPIDYSRPASDDFDSVQVEMLIKEEQQQKRQQDSLKRYLKEL